MSDARPILFQLAPHPLAGHLCDQLGLEPGHFDSRHFPDGETYLRVTTAVKDRHIIILADLSNPDSKFLPLVFLAGTLRDLGAVSVGLVSPYLPYMRQDRRFHDGEAITSRLFARLLSKQIDWLVTVDPHLHRYHSLDQIYTVPSTVVQAAPALAQWLKDQPDLLLVGPDAESEQWVAGIAAVGGHPSVVASKTRFGDREVQVTLPDLDQYQGRHAVIVDDVISSGQTIMQCMKVLQQRGFNHISCVAVHGIFADQCDVRLKNAGLEQLATCNTIVHDSNAVDVSALLGKAIGERLLAFGVATVAAPPA